MMRVDDGAGYNTIRFATDRGAGTEEVEVMTVFRDKAGVTHVKISQDVYQAAKDFWYIVDGIARPNQRIEWEGSPK